MTRGRVAAVFALAAVAPLFLSAGGNVMHNMVLAAAYVVMALGLNVIVGFAGLLDLGYVACFAIGAYTTAYFASGYWGIHLNFLLVLALAVATTAIAGTLIGVPTLRLRGDYIAVVTLAFGEIISQIAANGRQIELFGGTLTPGPIGIGPIDDIDLPLLGSFGTLDLRPWYWFALALVALALMVNVHLRDSRIGRAWTAMRDDETAAASPGSRSSAPSSPPTGRERRSAGSRARSSPRTWASSTPPSSSSRSRSSSSRWSCSAASDRSSGVVVGAIVLSVVNNWLLPDVLYDIPAGSAWTSTCRRSAPASTARSSWW